MTYELLNKAGYMIQQLWCILLFYRLYRFFFWYIVYCILIRTQSQIAFFFSYMYNIRVTGKCTVCSIDALYCICYLQDCVLCETIDDNMDGRKSNNRIRYNTYHTYPLFFLLFIFLLGGFGSFDGTLSKLRGVAASEFQGELSTYQSLYIDQPI